MPRVSVIIPAFNRPHLLSAAINSVLQQTFRDIELIIVDDGSEEDIQAVIPTSKLPISYYRQPNQGAAAARNLGLAHAGGEFIAFLDSDDLWLHSKLEKQLAVFEDDPHIGLVYAQAAYITEDGCRLARKAEGSDQHWSYVPFEEMVKANVVCGGGSSAVLRSSIVHEISGFDNSIRFVEDWDLWLAIAKHHRLFFLPELLTYYRINPLGFRTWAPRPQKADSLHQNILAVFEKVVEYWPDEFPDNQKQPVLAAARSREYLRHALVLLALERFQEGRDTWLKGIENAGKIAGDVKAVQQAIVNVTTGYASTLPGSEQALKSRQIVRDICRFSPLPEFQSDAIARSLTARTMVELAFLAAQYGDADLARKHVLRTLPLAPSWLANLGLLKLIFPGRKDLRPLALDN